MGSGLTAVVDRVRPTPVSGTRTDRGQAMMVGAILLLLLFSTAYVAAQVQVAPVVQADTEQRHARQLTSDMQRLQSDLIKVAATGQRQAHTIQMGSRYPFRMVLLHPPDPSSGVFNRHELDIRLDNVRAVDEESADFVDGRSLAYTSTSLNLQPQYYEFDAAPVVHLEHGTLYAEYADHRELSSASGLVDGRQINLVALEADVDFTTSRPITVQQVPLSASAEITRIQDTGSPIEFRLQTSQSLAMWRDVLGSEISESEDDGRYVDAVSMDRSTDPNTLVVRMVPGEQYQLNMAKVGIRRGEETGFATEQVPAPAYLTSVSSTTPVIGESQSMLLTVQVRDTYHNPVPSVQVDADAAAGRIAGDAVELSDHAGFATFRYEAPEVSGSIAGQPARSDTVTVSVDGRNGARWTVEYDLDVQNTHSSGG